MQGNWADFVLPGLLLCAVWGAIEWRPQRKKWVPFGIFVSIAFILPVVLYPTFLKMPFGAHLSGKANPFKHNVGWRELHAILKNKEGFLFSDKYQTVAETSFYAPGQPLAYFFNLQGARLNQYSYWEDLDERKGKDGIFVVVENKDSIQDKEYLEQLKPYFKEINSLGTFPLFTSGDRVLKTALLISGKEYNGMVPQRSRNY